MPVDNVNAEFYAGYNTDIQEGIMITKLIAFRVPMDIAAKLQEACSDQDVAVSEKLRQLVEGYLSPSNQAGSTSGEAPGDDRPNIEGRFFDLADRITRVERQTEDNVEDIITITERLDNIEGSLPDQEEGDINSENEPTPPAPGEISVEGEHRGRVQRGPEDQQEREKEKTPATEYEGHWPYNWPYNAVFKKKEEVPKEENELPWPFNLGIFKQEGERK